MYKFAIVFWLFLQYYQIHPQKYKNSLTNHPQSSIILLDTKLTQNSKTVQISIKTIYLDKEFKKMPTFSIERVYLYISPDFTMRNSGFDDLLKKFAETIHSDYNGRHLMENGKPCYGRIRIMLNAFANNYLSRFSTVLSEENLKEIITFLQIKRLRKASNNGAGNKQITVHVFFVIYSIVLMMYMKDPTITFLYYENVASAFRETILDYYNHTFDELANYALECDRVITRYCSEGIVNIDPSLFPAIPRQHPDDR
jgi:hypothetical protein